MTIRIGARVRICNRCPIDFNELGPEFGEIGLILSLSGKTAKGGVAAVSFDSLVTPWIIPIRFLDVVD